MPIQYRQLRDLTSYSNPAYMLFGIPVAKPLFLNIGAVLAAIQLAADPENCFPNLHIYIR